MPHHIFFRSNDTHNTSTSIWTSCIYIPGKGFWISHQLIPLPLCVHELHRFNNLHNGNEVHMFSPSKDRCSIVSSIWNGYMSKLTLQLEHQYFQHIFSSQFFQNISFQHFLIKNFQFQSLSPISDQMVEVEKMPHYHRVALIRTFKVSKGP
jgi:hypothetical protein